MTFEEWKNKTRERIDPDYLYFFDSFLKEFEDAYETGSAAESDVWTHTGIEGLEEKAFERQRLNAQIDELKKDNDKVQELLDKQIEATYKVVEELDKAKLIIKKLSWDIRNRSYNPVKDLDEAEAFLKEAERYE